MRLLLYSRKQEFLHREMFILKVKTSLLCKCVFITESFLVVNENINNNSIRFRIRNEHFSDFMIILKHFCANFLFKKPKVGSKSTALGVSCWEVRKSTTKILNWRRLYYSNNMKEGRGRGEGLQTIIIFNVSYLLIAK